MQTTASSRIKLVQKTFGELDVGDRFLAPIEFGQFLDSQLGELIKTEAGLCNMNAEQVDSNDSYHFASFRQVLVVEVYPVDLKPLFVTMIRDLIEHVDEHDKQKEGQ